ncbi:putative Translin-1 [Patellaria atrata CBS 101060]|uniref:Translin-1 n=1 Tax=Patellaria atrata CBS 101060 TaxID=1346257 RepID=A0A9P4S562_9PEZI|nr:putative Translin-1 [Patellaria atrata CBS 101060]
MASQTGMIDPAIFEQLQDIIDQDTEIRDELREILKTLEKQGRSTQAILSKAHSTSSDSLCNVVEGAEGALRYQIDTVSELAEAASRHPYYKYNHVWSHQIQDLTYMILLSGFLGGFTSTNSSEARQTGRLLTIEEVGNILGVPVNIKNKDTFHLSLEEYLLALITLIEELARLARNSVTLGDYTRPLQISKFIKDVHAGFQILNLKNDALRRRSDGIKYRVKEVEDVVYDLSLRNLIPKDT